MLEKSRNDPSLFAHILWSDETTVTAYPKNRELVIWAHSNVDKNDRPVNPTVQGGGFSVMLSGCFSRGVSGALTTCDGTMNAVKYLKLIKEVLEPEMNASEKELIFMQDNAPCHKAKMVIDYLRQKCIKLIDLPLNR